MSQQEMSSRKSNFKQPKETMIDPPVFRLLPCSMKKMISNFRQLDGSEKSSTITESTQRWMFSTFPCDTYYYRV